MQLSLEMVAHAQSLFSSSEDRSLDLQNNVANDFAIHNRLHHKHMCHTHSADISDATTACRARSRAANMARSSLSSAAWPVFDATGERLFMSTCRCPRRMPSASSLELRQVRQDPDGAEPDFIRSVGFVIDVRFSTQYQTCRNDQARGARINMHT